MDISVRKTDFQVENRSWLLGPDGTRPGDNPTVALDVSKFDEETHYPNGFIPSGIVLGKVTAGGKYGPYDPDASDGRQVAAEHLFSSVAVAAGATIVAGAGLHKGEVDPTRLPIASGHPGALDDAARLHLFRITYSDKATVIPASDES
jgi:hypothetical protein